MAKKTVENKLLQVGEQVCVKPEVTKCEERFGQLMRRMGFKHEDPMKKNMTVIRSDTDGQLLLRHPDIKRPLLVHSKFFASVSA